jgi:hypothetical protein
VRPERRSLDPMADDTRLDHRAARTIVLEPRRRKGRRSPAAKGAPPAPTRSIFEAACLLGCHQCLSDEWPLVQSAARTNSPYADSEIVVPGHGHSPCEVCPVMIFNEFSGCAGCGG